MNQLRIGCELLRLRARADLNYLLNVLIVKSLNGGMNSGSWSVNKNFNENLNWVSSDKVAWNTGIRWIKKLLTRSHSLFVNANVINFKLSACAALMANVIEKSCCISIIAGWLTRGAVIWRLKLCSTNIELQSDAVQGSQKAKRSGMNSLLHLHRIESMLCEHPDGFLVVKLEEKSRLREENPNRLRTHFSCCSLADWLVCFLHIAGF